MKNLYNSLTESVSHTLILNSTFDGSSSDTTQISMIDKSISPSQVSKITQLRVYRVL